jgi:transcriptional regulator with XRE-family HTH domain
VQQHPLPNILVNYLEILDLICIGIEVARRRKTLKTSQVALSRLAGVSRATLDALENGRAGELGFAKLTKLLTAL